MNFTTIEVFEEKKVSRKKTELVAHKLTGKNYYEENQIQYFSLGEIRAFLNSLEGTFDKILFRLLYETGARVSEALELKFSDLDFEANRIKVPTSKQRGKKIYRLLFISHKLKAELVKFQMDRKADLQDYIFSLNGTKAVSRQTVFNHMKSQVKAILGKSYLDLAHPHTLRHSRAIHLLDAGMNIMLLKNFLGHRNIANTLIYLQYSNQDLKEGIERANALAFDF